MEENRDSKQLSPSMKRYNELFPDAETKAAAFDRLAQHFYDVNFGTMSKADIEVLMFSEYIDRILDGNNAVFNDYSDYTLSKDLGITQSRVANLKVKKQLKYPHKYKEKLEKSLEEISKNIGYANRKIKLPIPDINLYYEISNSIAQYSGYVEITLTRKLLQVSPEYFIDLLLAITPQLSQEDIKRCLQKSFNQNNITESLNDEPFGKQLQQYNKDVISNIVIGTLDQVSELDSISPGVHTIIGSVVKQLISESHHS